ncbi:MAG: phage portal protein family protein [Brevinema sp.]
MKSKIEQLKSTKLLQLWGQIPNPDYKFLSKNGRSAHGILQNLTYIPEIQATILARESAVIGDPWEVVADSQNLTDFVLENLKQIGANTLFRNIFHGIWYGYTVLEHPMEKINGKWMYTRINSLMSDWFCFNAQGELVPSNHQDMSPLNLRIGDLEKEVELVQYRPTFANPYGESLLARVFWHATWLRGDMELWISYLDRFGDDSIIGKMDVADERRKLQMLEAITQFKSSGAVVLEGTDSVEVLKTDKANSSALFKNFYDICNQQISKLILGHASALEAQAGKLGNDQSLSIVRQDITQDDKTLIEEVVNRLIKHLCLVNRIKETVKFAFTPEKEDEKQKIERDQKLVEMGFELSEDYIRKTYRFGNDELKKAPIPNIPSFSEGVENGKKGHSVEYYKELDEYSENNLDKFKKPFLDLQESLLSKIGSERFWEDSIAIILKEFSKPITESEQFALDLMRALAIGQLQPMQTASMQSTHRTANFSEKSEAVFSTFEEAKKFFTSRVNLEYKDYLKLEDELKQYAFSVSGIVSQQHANELSALLVDSFKNGESFHKFKKSLRENEKLKDLRSLTERHLDLIYTQNMTNAYSYGRYKGLMQAVDIFPNWEYITIGDRRVRPSHAGVNGTVRRYDDPFWNTWYPPNGFRCRCVVEVSMEEPNGEGVPVWNKDTHQKAFEKTGGTGTALAGQKILPDKGFFTNKAQLDSWIGEETGKMAVNGALLGSIENWKEVGQKSLIKASASTKWNPKTNLKIPTIPLQRNEGERILESMLINHRLEGMNGEPVFVNPKYLRDHFVRNKSKGIEWNTRSPVIPYLDRFLKEADEVWGQYTLYEDTGTLLASKIYIKNINGSPWVAVVESPKQLRKQSVGKSKNRDMISSSLPSLTTFYPLNYDNTTPLEQLKDYRRGVRLK